MVILDELNYELYKCIDSDFINENVIITDRQIEHIKKGHPDSFEFVIDSLKEVLLEPDYIFKDKHPNTGLIVKKLDDSDRIVQAILRLLVEGDESTFKNSIISAWSISEKRLNSYLRNKECLYNKD